MNRKAKDPKYVSPLRVLVGENVKALMGHKHRDEPNDTTRQKKLAKESGVAYSSVQRVIKGEVGASIDVLEQLATALDVSVYQVFLPNLDVENPQIVQGASEAERAWYGRLRRSQQRIRDGA